MRKGLVMKVKKDFIVVLSDDHYIKLNNKHLYDQGQIIVFTNQDVYHETKVTSIFTKHARKIASLAAALLLVIAGGIYFNQPSYDTIVVVDINPSVQLYLDANEIVTQVEALNEDASFLNLLPVVGYEVADAIEYITQSASDAGFLNTFDLEDDYILVTTISKDDEDDVFELLEKKTKTSDILKSINVAITTATEDDLRIAKEQDLPVGLLNTNEGVTKVTYNSVSDYFSNDELNEKFDQHSTILTEDVAHKFDRIANGVEKSALNDALKSEIISEFLNVKDEFVKAKMEYQARLSEYNDALATGDEEAIQVAKLALDDAEAHKEQLEESKDDIDDIKDILLKAIDNEINLEDAEKATEELLKEQQKREEEKHKEQQDREDEKLEEQQEREKEKLEEQQEREKEKLEEQQEREEEKLKEQQERDEEKLKEQQEREDEKLKEQQEREEEKLEEQQERDEEKLKEQQEREEENQKGPDNNDSNGNGNKNKKDN